MKKIYSNVYEAPECLQTLSLAEGIFCASDDYEVQMEREEDDILWGEL